MRISQAMIVKDEERNIERALSWGKATMFEQIVVDTGSRDHTVALAEKLGARVSFFAWINDFSAAKNDALQRCAGDWICFMDADEYMKEEDAKKLPLLLAEAERRNCNLVTMTIAELDDDGNIFQTGSIQRFFKNDGSISYERPIHEQLVGKTGLRDYDASKEFTIYHTGYSDAARRSKPKDRNIKLIQEQLKKKPDDYEMLGYFGDEYRALGEYGKAVEAYQRSLCSVKKYHVSPDLRIDVSLVFWLQLLCFQLAWQRDPQDMTSSMQHTTEEELLRVYEEGIKLFPGEPDFDYLLGEYYFGGEEYQEAAKAYQKALQKLDQYGASGQARMLYPKLEACYEKYAWSLYETGQSKDALAIGVNLLKNDHHAMLALKTVLSVFSASIQDMSTADAVLTFLKKIYNFQNLQDKLILLYGIRDSKNQLLEAAFKPYFTEDEWSAAQANMGAGL